MKIKLGPQKKELLCLTIKKTTTQYCSNLDEKNVTDKKTFWKTVKPFLYRFVFGNNMTHSLELA